MTTKKLALVFSLTVFLLLGIVGIKFSDLEQREDGVLGTAEAAGNTYYVDGSVPNDTGDGSISNPKKYISSGVALMSGGDTLIIKDGIYRGSSNMITAGSIPNGSPDAYTTIRAENTGAVEIDGEGVRQPVHIKYQSYVQLNGIVAHHSISSVLFIQESHHIKVLRSAFYEAMGGGIPVHLDADFQYILLEDVWVWGGGRYKFIIYGGHDDTVPNLNHYVICRRCVARYDYYWYQEPETGIVKGPTASFSSYETGHNYYQNSIVVDSIQSPSGHNSIGFYSPGSSQRHDIYYEGCIALNIMGTGYRITPNPGGSNRTWENCVVYDTVEAWYNRGINGIYEISNSLVGNIHYKNEDITTCPQVGDACEWSGQLPMGLKFSLEQGVVPKLRNNLFVNVQGDESQEAALNGVPTDEDYSVFYGNTYNTYNIGTLGPHSLTNLNPIYNSATNPTGGLKYLVRVEDSSNLDGRGEGGSDIGPNITKRIGRSGTLYGEPGWNEVTDEDLWPWPYEDVFTPLMRAYNEHGVNGNRGFAAYVSPFGSPNTLTSYIWEYLGNPIPPEIYGGAPAILNITTTALPEGTVGITYSQNPAGYRRYNTLYLVNQCRQSANRLIIKLINRRNLWHAYSTRNL